MNDVATDTSLLTQTFQPAFDELSLIEAHAKLVNSCVQWIDVGLLTDENNRNLIVLLLNGSKAVSAFRFCLSAEESVTALKGILEEKGNLYLGYFQSRNLDRDQITSLENLSSIWEKISDQSVLMNFENIKEFFIRLEEESKESGRGKDFSTNTKRRVHQFSHGRCMFEGCGIDLGLDELTGYDGNFGYLAHNVASSEKGPRGGVGISQALSDNPKNVLLLCDKHHRLIDKIASADYLAIQLSEMRKKFKRTVNTLLEGLRYEPVPTFGVLWPVGGSVIAAPTELQISQALSVMRVRADGMLHIVADNNELLMKMNQNNGWSIAPTLINQAAESILQQTRGKRHQAVLFAFGFMPALIGLGAKIGNKAQITPMLRFRDSGTWTWPLEQPRDSIIEINSDNSFDDVDNEVVISIALTAKPKQFGEVIERLGLKHIEVTTSPGNVGNGCISHPDEGTQFMKRIHTLLHELYSEHKIKRIHLLPCASNAACVFLGKAIDNYHPEIIIYDFEGQSMVPRLHIKPDVDGNEVVSA